MKGTTRYFGVRVPVAIAERLADAADRAKNPYAPSQTQIIIRGIELALAEMADKQKGKRRG